MHRFFLNNLNCDKKQFIDSVKRLNLHGFTFRMCEILAETKNKKGLGFLLQVEIQRESKTQLLPILFLLELFDWDI